MKIGFTILIGYLVIYMVIGLSADSLLIAIMGGIFGFILVPLASKVDYKIRKEGN